MFLTALRLTVLTMWYWYVLFIEIDYQGENLRLLLVGMPIAVWIVKSWASLRLFYSGFPEKATLGRVRGSQLGAAVIVELHCCGDLVIRSPSSVQQSRSNHSLCSTPQYPKEKGKSPFLREIGMKTNALIFEPLLHSPWTAGLDLHFSPNPKWHPLA